MKCKWMFGVVAMALCMFINASEAEAQFGFGGVTFPIGGGNSRVYLSIGGGYGGGFQNFGGYRNYGGYNGYGGGGYPIGYSVPIHGGNPVVFQQPRPFGTNSAPLVFQSPRPLNGIVSGGYGRRHQGNGHRHRH